MFNYVYTNLLLRGKFLLQEFVELLPRSVDRGSGESSKKGGKRGFLPFSLSGGLARASGKGLGGGLPPSEDSEDLL